MKLVRKRREMNRAKLSQGLVENGAMTQSDSGLLGALRARSESAFSELHRLYAASLYRTILSITRNHEDAEDVLQETLLRAYLGLHSFEGRSKLSSWLTRIAINSSLMVLRKRRVRLEATFEQLSLSDDEGVPLQARDPGPNPEEDCLQREGSLRVSKALAGLRPSLRSVMQTYLSSGCSMEEIARSLNVSVAAVKARLHRARRHMAERTQREARTPLTRREGSMPVFHL